MAQFPPAKEADLLSMANTASALITSSPATYALSAGNATTLADLVSAFSDALALAVAPETRTKATISNKGVAKGALIENLRYLNGIVQASNTVTDAAKFNIGFPVYASRTPLPVPTESPVIEVVSINGRTTTINLRSTGTERRGKPAGVHQAIVISWTGPNPPDDIAEWTTQGLPTRTNFDVVFPSTVPAGSEVWISAAWVNPRGQAGRAATPVRTYIAGGLGMMSTDVTDSTDEQPVRKAA